MAIKVKSRKSKDGKTRYLALYETPDGRMLSAGTFGDKKAAARAATVAEVKAAEAQWVDPRLGKETLGNFVKRVYLDSITTLEINSQDNIKSNLKNWILPAFGHRAMVDIHPSDVQRWVGEINAKRSASTVAKAHAILHKIFKWAVKDKILVSNPCADTDLPTIEIPEVKIITPEEFDTVLEKMTDKQGKRILLVAVGTGMRWSELAALCPAQIDFLGRQLTVDRGSVIVQKNLNGVSWVDKPYPKGKVPRSVPLDDDVVNALSLEIARRGLDAQSQERIFINRLGNPIDRRWFNSQLLRPALKAAGLSGRNVTLKHLRSSYCSWLLDGGAPLAVVQKLMGHKQISTTQKYIAVLPGAHDEARAALRNVRNRSA